MMQTTLTKEIPPERTSYRLNHFHDGLSVDHFLHLLIHGLVFEMLENIENCLSHFHRATSLNLFPNKETKNISKFLELIELFRHFAWKMTQTNN